MLLQKFSGLPLVWDDKSKEMSFAGTVLVPDVRTLSQMLEVIYDKKWLSSADKKLPLYYMYRDVCMTEDKKTIAFSGLRYDITVFPAQMLGVEYLKTAGHNHPLVPDENIPYPELYEVVAGEAVFLIQKADGKKVIDARVIYAKEGDKFIIPPGFGHITINPGKKTLITANWVAREFASDYGPIKKLCGGAYFFTSKGVIKNPNYENTLDSPKECKPTRTMLLGLKEKEPMYRLVNNKDMLEFLTNPAGFSRLFENVQGV